MTDHPTTSGASWPRRRPRGWDLVAVAALTLGPLLAVATITFGPMVWATGLLVVWRSPVWLRGEKVAATLAWPISLGLAAAVVAVVAPAIGTQASFAMLVAGSVLGPLLVGVRLARPPAPAG